VVNLLENFYAMLKGRC